jgi:hypothetical protein
MPKQYSTKGKTRAQSTNIGTPIFSETDFLDKFPIKDMNGELKTPNGRDIDESINPLEGILDINLEDLKRYDDNRLLELILHLEERRHYGYLKDTAFKQRQFRDICEFLREIRNGTEETKRD